MIIAIDGPAASGKGTLARRLAAHYGLPHLDTGLLYRATARELLAAGGDPTDVEAAAAAARAVTPALLDEAALRGDEIAQVASQVAAIPEVRAALLDFQRNFGRPRGAVIDGRDIGTVVFPDADAKIFVTASPETRAMRRLKELRERGQDVIYAAVLREMKQRDERDSRRVVSPLVPAVDALLLDTSDLDADRAFRRALDFIQGKLGRR